MGVLVANFIELSNALSFWPTVPHVQILKHDIRYTTRDCKKGQSLSSLIMYTDFKVQMPVLKSYYESSPNIFASFLCMLYYESKLMDKSKCISSFSAACIYYFFFLATHFPPRNFPSVSPLQMCFNRTTFIK